MAKARTKKTGEEGEIKAVAPKNSLLDKFVFMDKTIQILDVGIKTQKNVVLYGPGE